MKNVKRLSAGLYFTIAAFGLSTSAAYAAIIVDQQYISPTPVNINAINGVNELAQSFTPQFDNVAGASVTLEANDTNLGDVTISLYENLPSDGGTLLTSATAANVGGAVGTFFDVTVFWAPVAVVPEVELFLVITSTNPFFATSGINARNPYTRGDYYRNGVPLSKGPEQTFTTFTDTEFGGTTSIPEPGSLAMFVLGFAGMFAARWRKAI